MCVSASHLEVLAPYLLRLKAVHEKKIIAAVCHGPGAFISAQIKHVLHKRALFYHKKITGFSNEEEGKFGLANAMPFLLEDRLTELGGVYSKAAEPLEVSFLSGNDRSSNSRCAIATCCSRW